MAGVKVEEREVTLDSKVTGFFLSMLSLPAKITDMIVALQPSLHRPQRKERY